MEMEHHPVESPISRAQENPDWLQVLSRPAVLVVLTLAVAAAIGVYLLQSSAVYGVGYPLDDAWIHQTYARNLGTRGEWAFNPGQVSGGSTAPLWSALLAAGYRLNLPQMEWTFLLGALSLFALSLAGEGLLRTFSLRLRSTIPWAGLFLIGEWHLAWAAVSGMETLLYSTLILLVVWRLNRPRDQAWFSVGALIGLSVWVRPDGLTLLGPAGLVLLFSKQTEGTIKAFGRLVVGVLLFFGPYLLFNYAVQGTPWPSTMYAKQAEYQALRELPLLIRWFNELRLPLIGAGIFLLPGFFWYAVQAAQKKNWAELGAVLWFLGYALVYALLLPVTYQYGRYFIPAMPVYFVTGLAGTVALVAVLGRGRVGWVLVRVWLLSAAVSWLAFFAIGAGRYAQDVAIIETEMVQSARWVAENTEPGAVVAAHDIGAMGFFSQRRVLDMAGLVNPEVTPFIRDEARLADWLDAQQAGYLVVFSEWYEDLPVGKEKLFETDGNFSSASGGKNTIVYRWRQND
jgi:hypothetical protein